MKTVKTNSINIKVISLILSLLIVFYLIPLSVYADNSDNTTDLIETNNNLVIDENAEVATIDDEDNSTYIRNDGIENYYPTIEHSAGAGGAGSINLSTGKLTFVIPTLTATDSLFAFTPTLVYNSSLAGEPVTSENVDVPFNTSYMPNGFKLNILETVTKKSGYDENNASYTYYTFYDSDGTTHNFFSSGNNTSYYDDNGLKLTLTLSGGNIEIEDYSDTVKTYSPINNSSWHLTSITDKYNNQLIFEFNSSYQPTKVIVKPNGLSDIEMLDLLYEGGKLCAVYNDSSKDSVIFGYSNGNLSTVRYCYGNSSTTEQNVRNAYLNFANATNVTAYANAVYTTDGNGYITSVRDIEANKKFNYEITNGKICKISEYAGSVLGQQISCTYGEGYTDVRFTGNDETLNTADDIITRYIFDEYGRALSVFSTSVNGNEIYSASTRIYEDSDKAKNNVKESAVLYGVNPDDIIESESNSNGYFATILDGTDSTMGVYKQTVMLVENPGSLTESNSNVEYIISGYGYSNSVIKNGSAGFSLGVNVYYYQGANAEDAVVTYNFDFANVENVWQYICGKFNCNLESTETVSYAIVRKIEVVCSYFGHPNIENESAYAYFKDIALTSFEVNNGYSYYYDSITGNLEAKKNSLYQEEYTYDDQNRITGISNSYNETYVYEYITADETLTHIEEYYKNGELVSSSEYTYDKYGLLLSTTFYGKIRDDISINGYDDVNITTTYEYVITPGSKIFGALHSETNSLGCTTLYDIDSSNGRLLRVINVSANTGYEYTYYGNGQLLSIEPVVMSGAYYVESGASVEYSYYANGQLSYIMTGSTRYDMLWDSFGNVSEVNIGDRTLVSYEYYPNNGKLKKVNYGNGFSEEYVYNTLEMLSEVWYTYDDGTRECVYSYTYNYDSSLAEVTDHRANNSTQYRYDDRGRLVSIGEKNANVTDYSTVCEIEYNTDGSIASDEYILSYTSGVKSLTTSYEYDLNGVLVSETHEYLSDNHKINYSYDNLNRLSDVDRDYGAFDYTTKYHYLHAYDFGYTDDTSYLVDRYTSNVGSSSKTYYYDYDYRGNITTMTKDGAQTTYTYDNIGQLVNEVTGNTRLTYTYDDAGNILSIKSETVSWGGEIVRAVRPGLPTTINFGYTNSEWGDLLTSYKGTAITYDEIGNPLSYYNGTAYTFTWEGRRLVGAVKGSNNMSFTYNEEGIRTSKTVNGVTHTYHLNGSQIIAEEWGDKLVVYLYDASGSHIGMMYRDSSYATDIFDVFWFEKNLHGDIVAVYNASGVKVAEYTYNDAWGNHTVTYANGGASTGAKYNPFRYRGYYYDTDLGMYYLNSRYYDSKICRFINSDTYVSTGQSLTGNNMFVYCDNNPVMLVDFQGDQAMPWNELSWPGKIHRYIQEYLRDNYQYILEVPVSGGRIDLVKDGYAYEIKPFTTSKIIAWVQLATYVLLSGEERSYSIGVYRPELTGGFKTKEGYAVRFYYMGSGIIQYSFYRNSNSVNLPLFVPTPKENNSKTGNKTAIVLTGVACIAFGFCGGGGGAPCKELGAITWKIY